MRLIGVVLILSSVTTSLSAAADLNVIGQATTAAALQRLVPQFESESGDTVHMVLGNPGVTLDRLRKNRTVDVIIVSTNAWPTVHSEGLADEPTRAVLGETKIGMAIAIGATKPTLDDVASFTAFIRRVRTIGLVDPNGGSGTAPLFMNAVEKLGLGPEISPKYRFFSGAGEAVADAIGRGDVETGATSMTELAPNKEIQLIGPVPSDALDWVGITYAAVGINADNPAEARAFLKFLTSPSARQAFSAIGLSSAP